MTLGGLVWVKVALDLPTRSGIYHRHAPLSQQITKLGEGTYGEVFRAPPSADYIDSLDESEGEAPGSIVVKLIPMEGTVEVNGAPQKGAGDLMAEAVIALALSGLRARADGGGELGVCTPGGGGG